MASEPRFDLELLGFRNDLARERVLSFLTTVPDAGPVSRDTALPHVLPIGVSHEWGLRLLGALRERGAQVRLVASPVATPEAPPPVAGAPAPPARRAGGWSVLVVVLIGLAAGALARFLPLPPARPPRPGAVAPAQPAASGIAQALNDQAVDLNAAGQFADAAQRLRAALARDPDQPALQRNLRTVLQNWAVAEINAERPDAAIPLLEEALGLENGAAPGSEAALRSALGIARVRLGEFQLGRDALERAVALGANDAATYAALAKAYRQLGEREAAVEALQQARAVGAQGPEFDAMLSRLERELDAEWGFDQLLTPHFSIGFAPGEHESRAAAELVEQGLERAYFHVGRKLDLYPGERVPVVLYPSEEFHDVTQTPSWSSGVYDGRIKLPVGNLVGGDQAALERTLRHEYAHMLVHELGRGNAPVWLNEGVAIWSEETRDGDRTDWALGAIAGQELFPLATLQGPFLQLPADRVHVAYAQSYLATRALLVRHGAQPIRSLLEALGAGEPFDQAFRGTFNQDLAGFESALVRDLTD
ncbi:MAG: peptidase MA family metallohydrolase [Deltaproteobacteria bacterium]|nr:peptidase MA family metallohydrolase [Deltaproteobacteria bacterium]